MLAGPSIVRVTHRAGHGTGPKYCECPAEIGTVGSYASLTCRQQWKFPTYVSTISVVY